MELHSNFVKKFLKVLSSEMQLKGAMHEEQALARHQTFWYLYIGLSSLRNLEQQLSATFKLPGLN